MLGITGSGSCIQSAVRYRSAEPYIPIYVPVVMGKVGVYEAWHADSSCASVIEIIQHDELGLLKFKEELAFATSKQVIDGEAALLVDGTTRPPSVCRIAEDDPEVDSEPDGTGSPLM